MSVLHNPVVDAILQRRSIRSFSDQPLTQDEVETIMSCGIWAPSGMNAQTTLLIACRDQQLLADLAQGFAAFNGSEEVAPIGYQAPCFFFLFDRSGDKWTKVNAALAVENMTLAAHSLGLGSVIIGNIYSYLTSEEGRQWQKRLQVSDDYEFVCGLAVGHGLEPGTKKPRQDAMMRYLP